MTDHVLIDVADGVATLTMNRPDTRNALSHEMRAAMADFLDAHRDDPAVRCIVLKGAGEHFMAGGDVKSFAEFARDMSPVERRTYFERRIHNGHRLILQLRDQPQPIIAAIRGGAAGY
ncbi:MAG: enoyl-CoA hydratase/isomerase family protein, partial [Pseudomonadota bacterium]|nr:enoyl-CoA hydratase/isomerase family protein [Pseudomonadota bacterium]